MKPRGIHTATFALVLLSMFGGTVITAFSQTNDRPHLVNFSNKYSQWGRLDWKTDRVTYVGDMPIEDAARAFFNSLYAGFSCLDGSTVPAGPKDRRHAPSEQRLRKLAFFSVDGSQGVVVELEKKDLEYRGDFPVDGRGKAFFAFLWQDYQGCFVKTQKSSSPE